MINNLILHQKELKNNSILHLQPLEDELKQEKFSVPIPLKHLEVEEFTTLRILNTFLDYQKQYLLKKNKESVMLELVQIIKKGTLKDKLNYLKKNIQIQQLLKTSEVDSIGKDKVLKPFWNEFIKMISQKLWLPTEIDFVDLDMNSLNGSLKNTMLKSWFSSQIQTTIQTPKMNMQKTYWQSLQFLLQEIMDYDQVNTNTQEKQIIKELKKTQNQYKSYIKKYNEPNMTYEEYLIKKEALKQELNDKRDLKKLKNNNYLDPRDKTNAGKTKHVKVYFTTEQKIIVNKWFGCSRFIYNQCITLVKNKICVNTIESLRAKIINQDTNIYKHLKWLNDYVYDLKDEAIRCYLKNVDSNLAKGKKFDISYKSKKKDSFSISLLAKHWNKNNFFKDIMTSSKLRTSEPLPNIIRYTTQLIKTNTKKYILVIPEGLEKQEQSHTNKSIFIDPGIYQVYTGFDPDGHVVTFGKKDIAHIARLQHYYKKLKGKIEKTKLNAKKRKRMKIALQRINDRIFNLVDDMHKKITNFLVNNYNNIHIPKLNFHNFSKLSKNHKARLSSLRHCALVDRIIHKTREYPKTKVFIETEEYTSKTCTGCGYIII
jgi:transposase